MSAATKRRCTCGRVPCVCPKFDEYVVVDARCGEVTSTHKTRREAESAVTKHSQRVRGKRVSS